MLGFYSHFSTLFCWEGTFVKKEEMEQTYQAAVEMIKDHRADDARPLLTRIYHQKDDYKSVSYYLGKACYRLKQYEDADRYLHLFLDLKKKTNRSQAYRLLARTAIGQKKPDEAKEYVEAAQQAGMPPRNLLALKKL
jgi:hypothetical protein